MRVYPITECPKCGCTTFKYKQKMSGKGEVRVNFDHSAAENGEMHDGLIYVRTGKYAYCDECGKRLFVITKEMGI